MGIEKLDLIAVAPHPDDAEIGVGGILAKLTKMGYKVGIIDLTDGEPTPYTNAPEDRLEEANNAAKILGVQVREILKLPNRLLMDDIEARMILATVFRKYRPDIVLSMRGTPLASPDHYQGQLITEAGIFYSKLTKWDERFDNTEPWRISHLLYYTTGRERELEFYGNSFVVNITEEYDLKKKALRAYKTQFKYNPKSLGVENHIESLGRYYGNQIRVKYGELLTSPTPIPIKDLIQVFRS